MKTIYVGIHPDDIAVNPNTDTVYVANKDSNTVSVIDGKTNAIMQTVAVGIEPVAVNVDQLVNRWYVANYADNSLSIISSP